MTPPSSPRHLYMVLSPHSLSYATLALQSLLANAREPLVLNLITDSAVDAQTLTEAVAALPSHPHTVQVVAEHALNDAEATRFARYPNLRAFRHGHPCWRKITDPVLLGIPGEELVLLDPDLFFPNPFRFEPTPAAGLLLMWQQPNCLLPPSTVRAALAAGIPLARHVDIGVSHWRLSPDLRELEWIDWLLGKLAGGFPLPRAMHVEAIVWSALAMHGGGGYLDPLAWHCWHRTQRTRIRRKLGASAEAILRAEPWSQIKCFHAGGEAKWWLPGFTASNPSVPHSSQRHRDQCVHHPVEHLTPTPIRPFVPLTQARYETEQTAKFTLRALGYHRFFSAS